MRTTKIGNFIEPSSRFKRERRTIKGLPDFEITRTGRNIWSAYDEAWVDRGFGDVPFPLVKLVSDGELVKLNRNAIVALAWLTPEQRSQVRGRFPQGLSQPWSAEALEFEQALGVSVFALQTVARSSEDELLADYHKRLARAGKALSARVEKTTVDHYSSKLLEQHSRRPSCALHVHALRIGAEVYTFIAVGTKQWVFKGDTVSFSYRVAVGGRRYVLRETVETWDAQGGRVVRGDRGHGQTLRPAPAMLLASRREQNDLFPHASQA